MLKPQLPTVFAIAAVCGSVACSITYLPSALATGSVDANAQVVTTTDAATRYGDDGSTEYGRDSSTGTGDSSSNPYGGDGSTWVGDSGECGGADLSSDPSNCGECRNVCQYATSSPGGTPACASYNTRGTCGFACPEYFWVDPTKALGQCEPCQPGQLYTDPWGNKCTGIVP